MHLEKGQNVSQIEKERNELLLEVCQLKKDLSEKANKVQQLETTIASNKNELTKLYFAFDDIVKQRDMLLDEKNKKNITNREHDCLFEDVLLGPSWSEGIALQEQFIKQCDEDVAMIFKEDKDPDLSTILNAKNTRRLNMRSSSSQWN